MCYCYLNTANDPVFAQSKGHAGGAISSNIACVVGAAWDPFVTAVGVTAHASLVFIYDVECEVGACRHYLAICKCLMHVICDYMNQ